MSMVVRPCIGKEWITPKVKTKIQRITSPRLEKVELASVLSNQILLYAIFVYKR